MDHFDNNLEDNACMHGAQFRKLQEFLNRINLVNNARIVHNHLVSKEKLPHSQLELNPLTV